MTPPIVGPALNSTVTVASAQVTLVDGQRYVVTSTTNCWMKIGANPTAAAAAAGNTYIPANCPHVIMANGAKAAFIRDTADGNVSLTLVA